jgi:hypothetical protein
MVIGEKAERKKGKSMKCRVKVIYPSKSGPKAMLEFLKINSVEDIRFLAR